MDSEMAPKSISRLIIAELDTFLKFPALTTVLANPLACPIELTLCFLPSAKTTSETTWVGMRSAAAFRLNLRLSWCAPSASVCTAQNWAEEVKVYCMFADESIGSIQYA